MEKQKVFKNLVKTLAAGLKQVFADGKYAEPTLEKLLSSDTRLGARDRRFIATHFYDIVRYWRHLQKLAPIIEPFAKQKDWYFYLASVWLHLKGFEVSHWEELENLPLAEIEKAYTPNEWNLAEKESIPDWMDNLGLTQLGDKWPSQVAGLNTIAPTYLRVNTLKTDKPSLLEVLATEGVEAQEVKGFPFAIELKQKVNVVRLGSFRKGLYEVQDSSSQLIAPFLNPQKGELIIDACAGAGGKTLHLAALMENEGELISMDVIPWKLEELKKRASRNGVKIVRTQAITDERTISKFEETADKLLLDAPCSGMGVLRRQPDSKWKLSKKKIEDVQELQAAILDEYSYMLKPGGSMVYATCSLMPSENEKQVERFLKHNPLFTFEKDYHSWPADGQDGFYMALLKRQQ